MNTRVLIILALIIAGIAGWFFTQQGEIAPPVSIAPSEVDYEATDIQAVQTNEQGETEYELNAESLIHDPNTNQDVMSGITMNWQPSAEQLYLIESGTATLNQETGDLHLYGGFSLASEDQAKTTESGEKIAPITVTGQALKGNTKSREVYSEQPVQVVQGENRFEAATMKANLETGDYEFGQVAVMFTPTERQDKALF